MQGMTDDEKEMQTLLVESARALSNGRLETVKHNLARIEEKLNGDGIYSMAFYTSATLVFDGLSQSLKSAENETTTQEVANV